MVDMIGVVKVEMLTGKAQRICLDVTFPDP